MARGYIYEIMEEPKIPEIELYDFEGTHAGAALAEYFSKEENGDEKKEIQKFLQEIIKKNGGRAGTAVTTINGNTLALPWIEINDVAKLNYFQNRFRELEHKVTEMSLREFATDDALATDLQMLIENRYDDVVYLDGTIYNLDRFIRGMEPNMRYYIGNIIHMH